MPIPTGKLVQASFFWKNDKKGGLGFTFGPPSFSSEDLTEMFTGQAIKDYMRESDLALGTDLVKSYLAQLKYVAQLRSPSLTHATLAAMNIIWLAERGFIPNDEFNGPQFVVAKE